MIAEPFFFKYVAKEMGWRGFIEKIWWIIPPVFVIFVFYPKFDTLFR